MSAHNAPNDAEKHQSQHGVAQIEVNGHRKVAVVARDDQAQHAQCERYVEKAGGQIPNSGFYSMGFLCHGIFKSNKKRTHRMHRMKSVCVKTPILNP